MNVNVIDIMKSYLAPALHFRDALFGKFANWLTKTNWLDYWFLTAY